MDKQDKLLTIEDISEKMHISVGTARNRLANGDPMPPSTKVGRRLLFPESDFHHWIRSRLKSNDVRDGFTSVHDKENKAR